MLPHLKKWTAKEKEKARKLFDEGDIQRTKALQAQPKYTKEEMLSLLHSSRQF